MQPSTVLRQAAEHTEQLAALTIVPFVVAVARWRDLAATGADTSTQFSVTFPTPHSFVSLWSFVNAPTDAGTAVAGGDLPFVVGTGLGVLFVVSLAAYVVLSGVVLAGYLGSVAEHVTTGSYDFAANVRRYARRMVGYQALLVLALLALVAGVVVLPAAFLLVAVVLFVAAYLTYLTPYLVVVADLDLLAAVEQSVALTTGRAEAAGAFLGFVAGGAVASVPLSTLAYGNGPVGGVIAAALAAPLGLFASVTFVLVARELTGVGLDGTRRRASPSAR